VASLRVDPGYKAEAVVIQLVERLSAAHPPVEHKDVVPAPVDMALDGLMDGDILAQVLLLREHPNAAGKQVGQAHGVLDLPRASGFQGAHHHARLQLVGHLNHHRGVHPGDAMLQAILPAE